MFDYPTKTPIGHQDSMQPHTGISPKEFCKIQRSTLVAEGYVSALVTTDEDVYFQEWCGGRSSYSSEVHCHIGTPNPHIDVSKAKAVDDYTKAWRDKLQKYGAEQLRDEVGSFLVGERLQCLLDFFSLEDPSR